MNIQIRVAAAQAQAQVKMLEAQIASLTRKLAIANAAGSAMTGGGIAALGAWGSKLQWAGRQLQYNFTMPILIAAGAATKFALDNEAQMTRLRKVYGAGSQGASFYAKEIDALGRSFEAMSNKFGVARSDVIEIAADWAAAGASGIALAKSTKLTIETMILGEMEATDATRALIAIQAQFRFSTKQLTETIDTLNMIENETGVTMADLVTGFEKAAGVARDAGIDVRHLGAMMAALVPAAGTASQAGNSIKTMVSRLLSPTKEAAEVLGLMGISMKDMSWQSLNGVQRLEKLSASFVKLDDAQKAAVSSTVASRWQINRFSQLMEDMANKNGYYAKALNATSDALKNQAQKEFELQAVLESSPRKLQQIWVVMQNLLANAIVPLIPTLIRLGHSIASIFQAFGKLDPNVKKLVVGFLLALAAVGPLVKIVGAFALLISIVATTVKHAIMPFMLLGKAIWFLGSAPFKLISLGFQAIASAALIMGKSLGIGAAFKHLVGLFAINTVKINKIWAIGMSGLRLIAFPIFELIALGFGKIMLLSMAFSWKGILASFAKGMVMMAMLASVGWMRISAIFTGSMAVSIPQAIAMGMAKAGAAMWAGVQLLSANLTWLTGLIISTSKGIPFYFSLAMAKLRSVFVFGFGSIGALWYGFTGLMMAGGSALYAGLMAIQTAFTTASIALWGAMQTAIAFMSRGLGPVLAAAWTATTGLLLVITNAFKWAMIELWVGIKIAVAAQWAALQAYLRLQWAATVIFLTSPAAMMAGFGRMFALIGALFAIRGAGLIVLAKKIGTMVALAFTGPWGWAIAGVALLIYKFRDNIKELFGNIGNAFRNNSNNLITAFGPVIRFFQTAIGWIEKAFWKLPQGVRDALMTVIRLVQSAAQAVGRLFGNIFSPFSGGNKPEKKANGGFLVGPGTGRSDDILIAASNGEFVMNAKATKENRAELEAMNNDRKFRNGGLVGRIPHFASGGTVSGGMNTAKPNGMNVDLKSYQNIADMLDGIHWNKEMATVSKGFATALPLFKRILGYFNSLNKQMRMQTEAVKAQEGVVQAWKNKLDAANASLDAQQKKLDQLQGKLGILTDKYDAHKQALSDYASAPIVGMGAMSDAIFENQMAQKKLQLQMAQWEKQHGSIDKVKNSLSALQGEIEKMQGNITELRGAGAGSDITGPLDAQLQAMKSTYAAMGTEANNSPVNQMTDQLEELRKQAEILDLEQAIQFDPLTRQIEKLANGMKELPYSTIIRGIKDESAAMSILEPQIKAATNAVTGQQAAVDQLQASRDTVQASYDLENEKLDKLQSAYQATAESVGQLEEAMRGLATAANDSIQTQAELDRLAKASKDAKKAAKDAKLSPGAQNFLDAAGANFDDVGGNAKIGREGGLGDQAAEIDKWVTDQIGEITFDGMDMWAPIKDMWNSAWKWIEDNIAPTVSKMWNAVVSTVSDIFTNNDPFTGVKDSWDSTERSLGGTKFQGMIDAFSNAGENIRGWWDTFVGWLKEAWNLFGNDLTDIWNSLWDGFERIFTETLPRIGELLVALKPVAIFLGGALLGAIKIVANILASTLGPVLNLIIDVVNAVIQVFIGLIDFVVNVFTGQWGAAFDSLLKVVTGLWDGIFAVFNGAAQILWGIVSGLVEGVVGFFAWLYDVIIGHSIIPDLINGIVDWFRNAIKWVGDQVSALVNGVVAFFAALPGNVWNALVSFHTMIYDVFTGVFKAALDAAVVGWAIFMGWLGTLGTFFYNSFIAVKTRAGEVATSAFNFFKEKATAGWNAIIEYIKKAPQNFYDNTIRIKDKFGEVATSAFNFFKEKALALWSGAKGILGWIGGFAQEAYDKFIGIRDKFASVASSAFQWFRDKAAAAWNGKGGIITWILGLPQSAANAISGLTGKLGTAATDAFNGFLTKAKEIWDGKNGIVTWFKSLPGKIAGILGGIGGTVANAVKSGWNGAAGWLNQNAIGNLNKATSKFGFTIPGLPTFERGGIIPGAVSAKDNVLIAARTGEGILIPEAVKALGGAGGLEALNKAARSGGGVGNFAKGAGLEAFAGGGVVGTMTDWLKRGAGFAISTLMSPMPAIIEKLFPNPELMSKFMSGNVKSWGDSAKSWGQEKDAEEVKKAAEAARIASNAAGNMTAAQVALINAFGGSSQMPVNGPVTANYGRYPSGGEHRGVDFGVRTGTLVKAFRAGKIVRSGWDTTGFGNLVKMDHGGGVASLYGHNSQLLRQIGEVIKGGVGVALSGNSGNSTGPHSHFEIQKYGRSVDPWPYLMGKYDDGGWLKPGQTMANNSSGRPEPVFSAGQWAILSSLVATSSSMLKSVQDGAGQGNAVTRGRAIMAMEARMRAIETKSTTSVSDGSGKTIIINGDLSFPNIRSGDDAETFIKNLEILAG